MGETGEMGDHVVGEIQCREGDKVSEALQLSELERSLTLLSHLQSGDLSCCCEGRDTSVPPNGPFLTTKMKSDKIFSYFHYHGRTRHFWELQ